MVGYGYQINGTAVPVSSIHKPTHFSHLYQVTFTVFVINCTTVLVRCQSQLSASGQMISVEFKDLTLTDIKHKLLYGLSGSSLSNGLYDNAN
jgi:hypothetical protein